MLQLGFNGIKDIMSLRLSCLANLKALFLQGNEIVSIAGLEAMPHLRELILDKNRIKYIDQASFSSLHNLRELRLE